MSGQGGDGTVTLQLVFRLLQQIQGDQRTDQRERRELQSLVSDQVEQGRRMDRHLQSFVLDYAEQGTRMDRRLLEIGDELTLMIKNDLMGRLGTLDIQNGHRFAELSERLEELEKTVGARDDEELRRRLRGDYGQE